MRASKADKEAFLNQKLTGKKKESSINTLDTLDFDRFLNEFYKKEKNEENCALEKVESRKALKKKYKSPKKNLVNYQQNITNNYKSIKPDKVKGISFLNKAMISFKERYPSHFKLG